jgi:hypothetical protein
MLYITETEKVKQKMFDVTTAFLAGAGVASLVFLEYSFSIKRRSKAEAISVA